MLKKLKKILLLTLFLVPTNNIDASVDPISKITITSNKATCQKDKNEPNTFVFNYLDNVLVTFADESKIKAETLEILLDTTTIKSQLDSNTGNTTSSTITPTTSPTQNDLSQFKKITFKNNVHISRINRTVDADRAELYLSEKVCKLFGNIKIKQLKENPKDLPIITQCQKAILDIQTEQITFLGDNQHPVSTTIELAGHPGLLKKVKTKKEKKAERKVLKKQKRQEKNKKKK